MLLPEKISFRKAICKGRVCAPASKSYFQRAVAVASLSHPGNVTEISGYTPSRDSDTALAAAERLGAKVIKSGSSVLVGGICADKTELELFCGESGLCMRMFSPIAALFEREITITGEGSLLSRPLAGVEEALRQLGKKTRSKDGKLPLEISGTLKTGTVFLDGSETSQVLTGLLIALSTAEGNSTIHVRNLQSKPYVQMTTDILRDFGIEIKHENFETFYITGNQKPAKKQYTVEGDWSGAAFLLVAGAVAGEIRVSNLSARSSQADAAILSALKQAGAEIFVSENDIFVSRKNLRAFDFDATNCPDLFPPLACLAAHCEGVSVVKGVGRLTHKESNRAEAIREEWGKIGIRVEVENDLMKIFGGAVKGGEIYSHNDHRIAMSGAILALHSENPVVIHGAKAVAKSYPDFYADFLSICH
jgi:3-phosphoshikimate 1-carboxyvinyltransferase